MPTRLQHWSQTSARALSKDTVLSPIGHCMLSGRWASLGDLRALALQEWRRQEMTVSLSGNRLTVCLNRGKLEVGEVGD